MKTKKNILFVHEVASQAEILASYLMEHHTEIYNIKRMIYFNHKYYKAIKYPESVLDAGCDIGEYKKGFFGKLKTSRRLIIFLWKNKKIILDADIIHFFSGSSFLPGNIDIYILKRYLKKKIVMEYNGSEVRQPLFSQGINIFYKLSDGCHYFSDEQVQKKLIKLQKYFDSIIVPYPELLLQIYNVFPKSKNNTIVFLPHIIDIPDIYNQKYFGNTQIHTTQDFTIIHAPSNKNTKGSVFIEKIVQQLQKKYPEIIYKELHNIPRNEVLNEIQNSNCVIDQMLIGDFGIFALEALSYGTPVFCFLLDEVTALYPEDLPLINVNIMTLFSQLEYYIQHPLKLQEKATESRKYVEKYNSQKIVGKQYQNLIEKL